MMSENETKKLWMKRGRLLVDENGRPYLCGKCPCGPKDDRYYIGWFCPCEDDKPAEQTGSESVGIYAESFLRRKGYITSNTILEPQCKDGRIFISGLGSGNPNRDYLERYLAGPSEWYDVDYELQQGTRLAYFKYRADHYSCIWCASRVHYDDHTTTAGLPLNTFMLDYGGAAYKMKLIGSYLSENVFQADSTATKTCYGYRIDSTFHAENNNEISVTFSLFFARTSMPFRFKEGETTYGWNNTLKINGSLNLPEESGGYWTETFYYRLQNITDGPAYTEDGTASANLIKGVPFPLEAASISEGADDGTERPEHYEDVAEPDWGDIDATLAGQVIGWKFYPAHWVESEKSFRIYDFKLSHAMRTCAGLMSYQFQTLPQDFE